MKIDPAEVRVVLAGPLLCMFRDRTIIEEFDSLRRSTGILHAYGLYRFIDTASWIPGGFRFRKEKVGIVQLPIDGDDLISVVHGRCDSRRANGEAPERREGDIR